METISFADLQLSLNCQLGFYFKVLGGRVSVISAYPISDPPADTRRYKRLSYAETFRQRSTRSALLPDKLTWFIVYDFRFRSDFVFLFFLFTYTSLRPFFRSVKIPWKPSRRAHIKTHGFYAGHGIIYSKYFSGFAQTDDDLPRDSDEIGNAEQTDRRRQSDRAPKPGFSIFNIYRDRSAVDFFFFFYLSVTIFHSIVRY